MVKSTVVMTSKRFLEINPPLSAKRSKAGMTINKCRTAIKGTDTIISSVPAKYQTATVEERGWAVKALYEAIRDIAAVSMPLVKKIVLIIRAVLSSAGNIRNLTAVKQLIKRIAAKPIKFFPLRKYAAKKSRLKGETEPKIIIHNNA